MKSDFRSGQAVSVINSCPSRSADDVSDWIDMQDRDALSIQLVWAGAVTAGVVTFESCEDPAVGHVCTVQLRDQASATSTYASTCAYVASASKFFAGNVPQRYFRVRVSTALVGGTVQCITHLIANALEPVNGMPAADSASRRIYVQPTDGTNSAVVKAASTAAAATDPALVVQESPNRYAQVTAFNLNSAASVNATLLKASAGSLTALVLSNVSASARYFKLFNKATAPVPGTDTPLVTIPIPANSVVIVPLSNMGLRFATGIGYAITVNQALLDNTSIGAGEVQVVGSYF